MTRLSAWTLGVLAAVALTLSVTAVVSVADLALYVGLLAVFTAPGWPLARWFAGDGSDAVTRTILALLLGYLAGAITCCTLRAVGVASPLAVLAACIALATLLAWLLRGRRDGLVVLVNLRAADLAGLGVLWLLAVAIVGPVFAHVGEQTANGLAYRAYFVADLWAHMSVVAELVKGATPPINPYFPTEPLPYYWAYFTLPALFSALRPGLLLVDRGILLNDTGAALMFVSVAYLVVRNLGASALAATLSWVTVILASSFEGAWYLWRQWQAHAPLSDFKYFNVDAATRWLRNLPGVDGFHRGMWWTPQHETALMFCLVTLLIAVRARRPNGLQRGVADGLLLGGAVAFSSFNGVLMVGWYALAEVLQLPSVLGADRRAEGRGVAASLGRWVAARGVAAAIVLALLGLTLVLGMVQRTPNSLIWGLNRYFMRGPWLFVLVNFGPALFLAPLGLARVFGASRRLAVELAALVIVAVGVFLVLDIRGHENAYVVFRTAQLFYLVLAVSLAFAIDAWRKWPRWASALLFGALAVGGVAAAPTVALDWYNAQDISNVEMSPGRFPWTIHVTRDEQAATRWIQANLPQDAIVQVDALPRERNTWALGPVFLRRRMATGNALFELNPARFVESQREIHAAYQASDADAAHAVFRRYHVDYVYVGEVERAANGDRLAKFDLRPDLFARAYRLGSVEIFKVLP
jgi:hypothetical protein